ncbi:MAG: hypothetical protein KIT17_07620 [Rubrivivax sp.]|nr:hypothetical protein [Rubrivivax sp.]
MAENESFFRKVVRFVANPATDWNELNSRQDDSRELDLEKSELKAMIERKRRNDFVRKREFDMLRRIRREGLSPEQAAALEGASRVDDSEARLADSPARADVAVKAKIDEIEQQMVGENFAPASARRPPSPPAPLSAPGRGFAPPSGGPSSLPPGAELPMLHDEMPATDDAESSEHIDPALYVPVALGASATDSARGSSPASASRGLPPLFAAPPVAPLAPMQFAPTTDAATGDLNSPLAVEVSEVMHDPELDEPVISFANADFQQCEEALQRLTGAAGVRHQHAETWLVLFDLYRATGQQQRFESLALDYAQQFGWSAPQWYSLPKLVAEAIADEPVLPSATSGRVAGGDVGWVSPPVLDIDAVARLRSQTLQMPLPWVFDWGQLRTIEAEAAMQLSTLFRLWAGQAIEMRWIGGDRLFMVLAEAAPTGVRDADPAFWLTRLDALRLANRADQFDEAAIDYCVTYEVSPPSWEAARCKVHISSHSLSTRTPPMSVVSEVSTSFLESGLSEDAAGVEVANVELSGQLVGDIGATLKRLEGQLGQAPLVNVSCSRLIRVDFIAAGDLLNWVLARRGENRTVQFLDAHRLVALFFGAMGINEHAKVGVRKV